MSIPHKARYQYIKFLELAYPYDYVHGSSIMVESWVAFIKLVSEVATKLSQSIPHMQTSDALGARLAFVGDGKLFTHYCNQILITIMINII